MVNAVLVVTSVFQSSVQMDAVCELSRWVAFRNEVLKSPGGREVLVQGRPKNTEVNWINDQIRELLKVDNAGAAPASVRHMSVQACCCMSASTIQLQMCGLAAIRGWHAWVAHAWRLIVMICTG